MDCIGSSSKNPHDAKRHAYHLSSYSGCAQQDCISTYSARCHGRHVANTNIQCMRKRKYPITISFRAPDACALPPFSPPTSYHHNPDKRWEGLFFLRSDFSSCSLSIRFFFFTTGPERQDFDRRRTATIMVLVWPHVTSLWCQLL